MSDAVVIGAGHNGLVAANLLADAVWDVTVLERGDDPGGAIRTEELTLPAFHHDVFSAFYPLAVGSPVFSGLELEHYGLEWCRAPLVVAHPTRDGLCPLLSSGLDDTAEALAEEEPSDAQTWRNLYERWLRLEEPLLGAFTTPFPPAADGLRMAARTGVRALTPMARLLLLPVRRMAEEEFRGRSGALLLAGNALHSDLSAESLGSGLFGWLLASLGQHYGYPVPTGGDQRLIDALVRRLDDHGGRLHCGVTVEEIVVRRGRAVAVRTGGGSELGARRAVLASIDAPQLLGDLVCEAHLPPASREGLRRFQCDLATFKVDWALDGPIPWNAEPARRAGTLHLGDSLDQLTVHTTQVTRRLLPDNPYVVVGRMTVADPSRSPAGSHTVWAYTTLPQRIVGDAGGQLSGKWRTREDEAFAERIEALAPGFTERITGRHILKPHDMQAREPSLVGGQRNGGTSQLYQQPIFRPTPGFGRPETPVRRLYLASASAHPSGGVHGGPGANAARAALRAHQARRVFAGAGAVATCLAALPRR